MIINKKSWHFWLLKKLNFYPAESLCAYFWQVMLAICLTIATLFIGSLLALVAFMVCIIPIFASVPPDIAILGMVVWLVFGAVAVLYFKEAQLNGRTDSILYKEIHILPKREDKPKKEPGLFRQYLKALHTKVCPMLEFK